MRETDETMRLRAHLHSTLNHALETAELIEEGWVGARALDTVQPFIKQAEKINSMAIQTELNVRQLTPATVVDHAFHAMSVHPGAWLDQCNYGFPEERCDYPRGAHLTKEITDDR